MLELKHEYCHRLRRRADLSEDLAAGKDGGQEEEGATEGEMASLTWWT